MIGADEYYINYAEPEVQPDTAGSEVKGKDGVYALAGDEARAFDRKYAGGNPVAARELAKHRGQVDPDRQEPAQDQEGARPRRRRSC